MNGQETKKIIREGYAKIAKQSSTCCGSSPSCCGGADVAQDISRNIGYSAEELSAVPEGANLGLGCGNPVALASLKKGETVLDLGSGAGFDCFLAAGRVGEQGRVIGVDVTPEMIEKAGDNAKKGDYANVEFRLGEIERLPVADGIVDAVISNCVINLSPDKKKVFSEVFRALKPGGRMMISDIVLLRELPDFIKNSIEAYIGCVSGAQLKDEYLSAIKEAGFQDVKIMGETAFPMEFMANDPTAREIVENVRIPREKVAEIADSIRSIKVHAVKPTSITS
ncbi:MAG: arsenite S-adenosylmethyltransferase [Deltaproteobacteria bacterium RBG_16_54_18]|nr:MAG: arsenite S-adenosylmethyltransferase [Deltaproteobacteria bacterium RBG_16_54_18]